eukprot:Sspe_Gene.80962::Locus_51467_Transcript_2_2_Confidence_0.800_Length_1090::g.80962::m.80962
MSSPSRGLTSVVETYPNGDVYEGHIGQDGMKTGWGKYTFANGKVYEGHWKQGKMDGWGEFHESDTKDRFVGEWEAGNRKFGIYFYANGDMYQGGFEQSMKHGKGIIWENKEMYEALYDRDRLLGKVPWKRKMDEGLGGGSALQPLHSSPRHSPRRAGGGEELAAAQLRIAELQDLVSAQSTQIMVLTKEVQSLSVGGGGPVHSMPSDPHEPPLRIPASPSSGMRGTRAHPQHTDPIPRNPTPTRGRAPSRGPVSLRTRSGAKEPVASRRKAETPHKVCFRKRNTGAGFDRMSESHLREQFRFYN